jgi:hypothetical protein
MTAQVFAWFRCVLFLGTVTLGSLAATAAVNEPFTIAPPTEGTWGPIVLVVIEHRRAYPTGGYWCPPVDEGMCLGASLVQGSARVVRYLSRRPEGWRDPGPVPQVRFIGGHAVRWVDAGVRLAILEQTDGGYLWRAWSSPADRGWACFDPEVISGFQITSQLRLRARGESINCFRLADVR